MWSSLLFTWDTLHRVQKLALWSPRKFCLAWRSLPPSLSPRFSCFGIICQSHFAMLLLVSVIIGLLTACCFVPNNYSLEWWFYEILILLSGLLPNPKLETSVISIWYTSDITCGLLLVNFLGKLSIGLNWFSLISICSFTIQATHYFIPFGIGAAARFDLYPISKAGCNWQLHYFWVLRFSVAFECQMN